MSTTPLPDS
ncbi:hypothetical protein ACTFIW_003885 [Dictyostelium discoideum]